MEPGLCFTALSELCFFFAAARPFNIRQFSACAGSVIASQSWLFGSGFERLKLFYPDLHTFKAARQVSGGYEVFIEIPYEKVLG